MTIIRFLTLAAMVVLFTACEKSGSDVQNESKPAGDGRNVKVKLNGTPIVNANLDEHRDKEAEHPGILRTRGHVGLQNHGTRLDFRNVRLRVLP